MKQTALNKAHKIQGAKMVEFAGYDMPIQYEQGMLKEHQWVREGNVGIFDVSHMGQFIIEGENCAKFLSTITPSDFLLSKENLAKYTVLTNKEGGIIDDLIITKLSQDKFFIVLNAACKEKDVSWINKNLPSNIKFQELSNRSLIAIQGAKSEEILCKLINESLQDLNYMNLQNCTLKNNNAEIFVSRTGYTGEDGFEISIDNNSAEKFWLDLSNFSEVKPIGLGARDSLRLEMGYPLYGHDLNDNTTPIEAGLSWVVAKENNSFIGCDKILLQRIKGTQKKRLGVKLLDRGVIREGFNVIKNNQIIGKLTSGGFSPSLKTSIGQGYFDLSQANIGDEVFVEIRNRQIPAQITSPTFLKAKTKSIKK